MSVNINAHYEKIYRYCYFKIKNKYIAEDLTQETFLKFLGQSTYVDREKKQAYLYTIAKNLCIDYMRKEQPVTLPEELHCKDELEKIEIKSVVKNAIAELPKEVQELVLLRYANDLKVGTIAKITGISRFVIYRKLKTALKDLRIILREEDLF